MASAHRRVTRRGKAVGTAVIIIVVLSALINVFAVQYVGSYVLKVTVDATTDPNNPNIVSIEASLSTQPDSGVILLRCALYLVKRVFIGLSTSAGGIYLRLDEGSTAAELTALDSYTDFTLTQAPSGWVFVAILIDMGAGAVTADVYVGDTNIGSATVTISSTFSVQKIVFQGAASDTAYSFYVDDVELWWWPDTQAPPATGNDLVLGDEATLEGTDDTTNLVYADDFEDQATDFEVTYGSGSVEVVDADAEGVGDPNPPWGSSTTTATTTTSAEPSGYYVPITITNSGSNDWTDYTVRLVITSGEITWGFDIGSVYFTDADGNPLYYFVEYMNNNYLLAWVKVPSLPAGASVTIYMHYGGDNPYASYNSPTNVFIFWDDFETWEGWSNYGSGAVSQDSTYVFGGSYSLKKDLNNDPNGGIKSIGTSLTDKYCLAAWIYRPATYSGGDADRVSVVDDNGDGYGFSINHNYDAIYTDIRSSYSGSGATSASLASDPLAVWYYAEACVVTDTLYVRAYKIDDFTVNGETQTGVTLKTVTTVLVAGGYTYYVDNLRIVTYDPSISYSIGSEVTVTSTATATTTTTTVPQDGYVLPITVTNDDGYDRTDFTVMIVVKSDQITWGFTKDSVYFTDESGNPLYYFVEYMNDNYLLAWVKIPFIADGASITIYMHYWGDNPYTAYNSPSAVFVFWDDFETWEGWADYGGGTVTQSSDVVFSGSYSAKKDLNSDPAGAVKDMGVTLSKDYCLAAWLYRPSNYAGGAADRLSIIDSAGTGFGFGIVHGDGSIAIDFRDSYSRTSYEIGSLSRDPLDEWYFAMMCYRYTETFHVFVYDVAGFDQLASATYSNRPPVDVTHVFIAGGYTYYVDNLRVIRYSPYITYELGTESPVTSTTTATETTTSSTLTDTTSTAVTTTTSGYQTLTTTTAPLNPPELIAQYRYEGTIWGGTEFINNQIITDGYIGVVTPQADVVQFSHVITNGLVQAGFKADPAGSLTGVAVGGYYSEGVAVVYDPSVDEIQLAKVSWSGTSWTFISTLATWRAQYAEPFEVYVKFGVTGSGGVVSICVYAGGVETWYRVGEDTLQGALSSIPYIVYIGGVSNAVGDIAIMRGDYVVVRQGSIGTLATTTAGTVTASEPLNLGVALPLFLVAHAEGVDVGAFWVELAGTDALGSEVRVVVWDNGNGDADPNPGVVMLADLPVVWPLNGYLSVSYPVQVDPAFVSSITELSGEYENYFNSYYTTTPLYQAPGSAPSLPPPIAGAEKYVAFFIIALTAMLATAVLAPAFVFVVVGEAALFTYWGWLNIPESATALFIVLGLLAFARIRKGG